MVYWWTQKSGTRSPNFRVWGEGAQRDFRFRMRRGLDSRPLSKVGKLPRPRVGLFPTRKCLSHARDHPFSKYFVAGGAGMLFHEFHG